MKAYTKHDSVKERARLVILHGEWRMLELKSTQYQIDLVKSLYHSKLVPSALLLSENPQQSWPR